MIFNFEFDIGTAVRLIGSDNTWYTIKYLLRDRTMIEVKGLVGKFSRHHVIEYSNSICPKTSNSCELYRVDGHELKKQVGNNYETVYVNKLDQVMSKAEMIRAYKFMVN